MDSGVRFPGMARARSYDGSTRTAVLTWARHGWDAAKIAEKLDVSTRVVYYHLRHLADAGEIDYADVVRTYRPRSA